jgi:hypothetical protein
MSKYIQETMTALKRIKLQEMIDAGMFGDDEHS